MNEITSTQNNIIKETKKLLQKKYRDQKKVYLLEGEHLVEEALQANQRFEKVFVTSVFLANRPDLKLKENTKELYLVSDSVAKTMSSLPTPQGIVAVIKQQTLSLQVPLKGPLLILDRVQDPGNVGTMIRTADSANFAGVILGKGSADLYSPKVQRALQGSHFHLPVIQEDLLTFLPELKKQQIVLIGTALDRHAQSYKEYIPANNFALIMGNEGQGVAKDILQVTDVNLYIPITGQAESLNVAVAAGILMYSLLK